MAGPEQGVSGTLGAGTTVVITYTSALWRSLLLVTYSGSHRCPEEKKWVRLQLVPCPVRAAVREICYFSVKSLAQLCNSSCLLPLISTADVCCHPLFLPSANFVEVAT